MYIEGATLRPPLTDGIYGDGTHVAQVTVDGGAITDIVEVALDLPVIVTNYAAAFSFLGGVPPITLECMGGHIFPAAVDFDADFAGAVGHCEIAPASSFEATIYHIVAGVSTSIGTMTVATDGTFTFSTSAAPISVAIGDSLKFVAPSSVDAQIANVWWTLYGIEP